MNNSSQENLFQAVPHRNNNDIEEFQYLGPRYRLNNVPRPCFYMLRLLGVWQPPGANIVLRIYTKLIWLVWALIIGAILIQMYLHDHKFTVGLTLNNIGTVVDFCCPLIFLRYYFAKGNFERLVSHVYEINDMEGHRNVRNARFLYTGISLFMWCCSTTFFTYHWIPFWEHKKWKYVVYIIVILFTMGWWSTWFSLYGFVCHVHRNQILLYRKHMISTLTVDKHDSQLENVVADQSYGDTEKKTIGHLLFEFNDLQNWLDRTQKDFTFIISVAVAYHILDMFVFSLAYFTKEFGPHYPIFDFCGTIIYDLISILIKLYPAAVVCQAVHKTVRAAGDLCVLGPSKKIPYARFEFYQHLCYREQDMGLRILGVKITQQLMVGTFVTIGTALMGFFRLIVSDSP